MFDEERNINTNRLFGSLVFDTVATPLHPLDIHKHILLTAAAAGVSTTELRASGRAVYT
jgi:hypothetical protein